MFYLYGHSKYVSHVVISWLPSFVSQNPWDVCASHCPAWILIRAHNILLYDPNFCFSADFPVDHCPYPVVSSIIIVVIIIIIINYIYLFLRFIVIYLD